MKYILRWEVKIRWATIVSVILKRYIDVPFQIYWFWHKTTYLIERMLTSLQGSKLCYSASLKLMGRSYNSNISKVRNEIEAGNYLFRGGSIRQSWPSVTPWQPWLKRAVQTRGCSTSKKCLVPPFYLSLSHPDNKDTKIKIQDNVTEQCRLKVQHEQEMSGLTFLSLTLSPGRSQFTIDQHRLSEFIFALSHIVCLFVCFNGRV